ncbi:MAG: hypothetical protein ACRCUT_00675, partial [Spirochaetota bacterium]
MNDLRKKYQPLADDGYLSLIDLHCADTVLSLEGKKSEPLYLAVCALSRGAREKHVCIDLDSAFSGELPENPELHSLIASPDPAVWRKELLSCASVGRPGEYAPVILDGTHLYPHKYFYYEELLASRLSASARLLPPEEIPSDLLDAIFAAAESADWQRCAAVNALMRNFSVVTGGPGTGKTTTAAKILILCAELFSRRAL